MSTTARWSKETERFRQSFEKERCTAPVPDCRCSSQQPPVESLCKCDCVRVFTSGVRGGRSGAQKNVQGHMVSRDTWCPRRAVRERRRPSQDSWPSWDSTVLGQRKCPGTTRGVLGQPTPSQDGDCPGHRVSRDTFASRTSFASQDIPPDPQMQG